MQSDAGDERGPDREHVADEADRRAPVHWPDGVGLIRDREHGGPDARLLDVAVEPRLEDRRRDVAGETDGEVGDEREPEQPGQAEDERADEQRRVEPEQRRGQPLRAPACSRRFPSGCATAIESRIVPAPKTPNQTTGSSPPSEGSPMSRMKCACQSRSKPSLHIPANAAMPRIARSAGRARTRRAPCARRMASSGRTTHAPPAAAARTPVSGIARAKKSASRIVPAPATTIGRRRSIDREADAGADAGERGDAPDLGAAQVDAGEALLADLVREPGVEGAARERVAEAPERVRGEDRPHARRRRRRGSRRRPSPRCRSRSRGGASRCRRRRRSDLEDEDRDLHQGADENELEGAHARPR